MGPRQYLKRFDYEVDSIHQNVPMFGARTGANAVNSKFALWSNYSKNPSITYGSIDSGYITSVNGTGRHNISTGTYPDVKLYFDGVAIYEATANIDNTTSQLNLYIFEINNNGSPQGRKIAMNLYGITIADASGDLMRAVPALRIADSEPGLYDFVRKVFLTKAKASSENFLYE